MPAPKFKFSEFIDMLLVRLYELDRLDEGDQFFDLNSVARQLKEDVPTGWVFDAAKVLESRGLAHALYTFGGTHAQLTGEGRLYVEEGRGITRDVQRDEPKYFNVTISGGNNQIVGGNSTGGLTQTLTMEEERQPVFRILDQIRNAVQNDRSLSADSQAEALASAEMIKLQLKKPEPNRSVIAAVLDPLSKIASIAGNVGNLVKLLNG